MSLARERAQWLVRCQFDGSRHHIVQRAGGPVPTECPDDPTHPVRVTLDSWVDAAYDPSVPLDAGLEMVAIVGDGAFAMPIRPITSPSGWLANGHGQLLVEG